MNQQKVKAPRMNFHNFGGKMYHFWPIFDQALTLKDYDKSQKGKNAH